MSNYKILTINPGSTSTKVGYFVGDELVFSQNVKHDAAELEKYPNFLDQLPYRSKMIDEILAANNIDLTDCDAYVGRGGGLLAIEGGVYTINDKIIEHASVGANGVKHPAQLGPLIANAYATKYGKPAFVVNPPDTDELCDYARVTGIKGVYRNIHLHALNLKETAIRHAASQGKKYEECNFIVCHIGGGISVSAHDHGMMVDGNDIVGGEGPMAPTRCGAVPISEFVKYAKDLTPKEQTMLCMKTGGFVSHLGTSDAIEVTDRAAAGDKYAELIWNSMIYQIAKYIGDMAVVLKGKVDGILLGGGMVHSKDLVNQLTDYCSWIAPVYAYPGEFELEAMAAGATRALDGVEAAKTYTGEPRWKGFNF